MNSLKSDFLKIAEKIAIYSYLPFSSGRIPGTYAENIIAEHYNGEQLHTYDFVDVVSNSMSVGWQVKSSRYSTPVTWKRAKISDSAQLIFASDKGDQAALERLGKLVLKSCNDHIERSLNDYNLKEIRYARILLKDNKNYLL